jgi:hypothetical protein
MKTPKQLADEYTQAWWKPREDNMSLATRQAFMASFRAGERMNWTELSRKQPHDGDRCLVTAPEWNIVLDATWNCNDTGIFFAHEAFDEKFHKILPSDATLYWTLAPKLIKDENAP